MYKLLHTHHVADFLHKDHNVSSSNKKCDSNFLHRNQGANPYNVLLVSGMLTLSSVVMTWIIEWIANAILLQH